jgi:hypothetical protein
MRLVGLSPIADVHIIHHTPPTLSHQPQDGPPRHEGVLEDAGDVGAGGGVAVEEFGDEVLGEGVLVGGLVGAWVIMLVGVLVDV